jgi:transcriptional regulator with XRE-family HTH domain
LVREYFGLDQQTLAAGLGVAREQLAGYETGRRGHQVATAQRLLPLLQALPAAAAPPADPAAGLAPPAPAALLARLDYCRHHAARLRRELGQLETTLEHARRWQAALPGLLATADERTRPWLLRRQEQAAADLDAEASAQYHLLRLRAEALEAEAAALAALLLPVGPAAT